MYRCWSQRQLNPQSDTVQLNACAAPLRVDDRDGVSLGQRLLVIGHRPMPLRQLSPCNA